MEFMKYRSRRMQYGGEGEDEASAGMIHELVDGGASIFRFACLIIDTCCISFFKLTRMYRGNLSVLMLPVGFYKSQKLTKKKKKK